MSVSNNGYYTWVLRRRDLYLDVLSVSDVSIISELDVTDVSIISKLDVSMMESDCKSDVSIISKLDVTDVSIISKMMESDCKCMRNPIVNV